jgi:hypothetical protein
MDDTGWHGEPVKVPPFVLEGIQAVQISGKVDTFDRLAVGCLAVRLGYPQTARWIKCHPTLYIVGVLYGFEPNN